MEEVQYESMTTTVSVATPVGTKKITIEIPLNILRPDYKFLVCANPGCGKTFVDKTNRNGRRKIYCSDKCQNSHYIAKKRAAKMRP